MNIGKLGCLRSAHDDRKLWLSDFLPAATLPPLLPAVDNTPKVTTPWGMMLNDAEGDCVVAAEGHQIMVRTFNAGKGFVPPDAAIQKAYCDISGYVPGDESTDVGCDPVSALKYFKKHGIAGHKIGAYLGINPGRMIQFKYAIQEFDTAYIALSLPYCFRDLKAWVMPKGQKPVGDWAPNPDYGHMVTSAKFSPTLAPVITWGEEEPTDWLFLANYCTEAYVILSTDQLDGTGKTPQGLNLASLRKAIVAVSRA